jgi:DNA-binding PadR family transcriptional regulator
MFGTYFDLRDFGKGCGDSESRREARARWGGGWEDFMGAFWGGGHRGRGRRHAGRIFEQGDLKYVILRLLAEKPRHGYEIIKELEERFGGAYAPSPGTVYPTLTMLEDMGFARANPEEGGRRIYEITEEGRKHLSQHSDTVNDIFERIARFVEGFFDEPMADVKRAFGGLGRATFSAAGRAPGDKELLEQVSSILKRAATEIDELARRKKEARDTSDQGQGGAQGATRSDG